MDMITDAHRERELAGRVRVGTVRGVIVDYRIEGDVETSADLDALSLLVTGSDIPSVVAGQTISVRMPRPMDGNFLLRDLRAGFSMGDLEPVPEGSEVTFAGCESKGTDHVDVTSYEIDSIERPDPGPMPR